MAEEPDAPAKDEFAGFGRRAWIGYAGGVIVGALFAAGFYVAAQTLQSGTGLILVSVMLIPCAASALAVLVAGIKERGFVGKSIGLSVAVTTTLLVGSTVIFREGTICVAMAAPIFYPFAILGGVCAAWVRTRLNKRSPASVFVILPLVLLPLERQDAYPTMHATVSNSIEIAAPIDVVWREATEIRDIAPGERTRTLTQDLLRVPHPTDARLITRDGALVRQASWEGGVRFYEVVTEWRPHRSVAWTFDIPEDAADRLLDEHLRLDEGYLGMEGGRYTFEALSPTRTRLTLTTQYRVRTPLNAYAQAWGEVLLGDIHRNVLHVVHGRALKA